MPKYSQKLELDFEEVFLDKIAKEGKAQTGLSERKLEVPLKKVNFLAFLSFGIFIFGFLALFSSKMIAFEGEKYQKLAQQNQYIIANIKSERGIIFDRNMKPMVQNEAGFDLWLDKSLLKKSSTPEAIIAKTADFLEIPQEELQAKISSSTDSKILILETLNHDQIVFFDSMQEELLGFYTNKKVVRNYENLLSLSHILGYLGKISPQELKTLSNYEIEDSVGRTGIEKQYESILRERKGKIQIERTAQGREISRQVVETPKSGDSVMLSLDLALQQKTEEVFTNILKETGSKKGAVIALDPRNGEVLTMVSWPTYDNNLFSQGISQYDFDQLNQNPLNPQLNRALAGLYPSGSAVKPFVGMAALEAGVISKDTTLYCPQKLCLENIYSGKGECFVDWTFHGYSNITRALAESINPFFYMIAGGYQSPSTNSQYYDERLPKNLAGLGIKKLADYLSLFNFGKISGIDLPGEQEGRVPTPQWKQQYFQSATEQAWYKGDTYNLSIGQGYFLVTPLQMVTAVSAIANNGKLYRPQLLKEILPAYSPEPQKNSTSLIAENFVSQNSIDIIKDGMRQVVLSGAGSAHSLSRLPFSTAAKTGTAQLYPNKEIYDNWIILFAPYENPEIAMVVLIEDVQGISSAAQRTAREILDWYFQRSDL